MFGLGGSPFGAVESKAAENEPYIISAQNPKDPFAKFRETCRELESKHSGRSLINSVAMVGAKYDPLTANFSFKDGYWWDHTVEFCHNHDILISHDFKLLVTDLRKKQDVLDPNFRMQADILVICYVLDPTTPFGQTATRNYTVFDSDFLTSPYHSDEAWRQLARNSNSKLIVTFTQRDEVGTSYFAGNNFICGPTKGIRIDGEIGAVTMGTVIRRDLASQLCL